MQKKMYECVHSRSSWVILCRIKFLYRQIKLCVKFFICTVTQLYVYKKTLENVRKKCNFSWKTPKRNTPNDLFIKTHRKRNELWTWRRRKRFLTYNICKTTAPLFSNYSLNVQTSEQLCEFFLKIFFFGMQTTEIMEASHTTCPPHRQ